MKGFFIEKGGQMSSRSPFSIPQHYNKRYTKSIRYTTKVIVRAMSLDSGQIMKLRERAGLTQRQVAEALGKTDQTVSNWENGVRSPKLTPKETLALCRILKCSLEELAGELGSEI